MRATVAFLLALLATITAAIPTATERLDICASIELTCNAEVRHGRTRQLEGLEANWDVASEM